MYLTCSRHCSHVARALQQESLASHFQLLQQLSRDTDVHGRTLGLGLKGMWPSMVVKTSYDSDVGSNRGSRYSWVGLAGVPSGERDSAEIDLFHSLSRMHTPVYRNTNQPPITGVFDSVVALQYGVSQVQRCSLDPDSMPRCIGEPRTKHTISVLLMTAPHKSPSGPGGSSSQC